MSDPFSVGTGIVGVIGVAIQIAQIVVQFGLDWKYAPQDVKTFMTELQILRATLSETNTNLLLNSDFGEAFQKQSSLLLSQLGPGAPPNTEAKRMLQICEEELKNLLYQLEKRSEGHQVGWERIKGAFLSKRTRMAVENLHRQCQGFNNMLSIDAAVLGVTIYKEVREVKQEQQEARKEQEKWHQARENEDLLTWLTPIDYDTLQSDLINRRQEGTGQWLLDSHYFQTWVTGKDQILFCPGMPGAGKTMCASIVVDELYSRFGNDTSVGIAYVYCNFRRQHEQTPLDIFASMLKQLSQGLPSMPQSVQHLFERHRVTRTRPSFNEICEILQSVVSQYSKTFIVVDALDEFQGGHGTRKSFCNQLLDLQSKTAANLLVTSRYIPEIQKEFDGAASIEIRASSDDVRRYLSNRMPLLRSFVSKNLNLQEEIMTEVTAAVDGMFLLAQLYLDSLADKTTPKQVRLELKSFQNGSTVSDNEPKVKLLDHAYEKAMERIKGQGIGSKMLAQKVLSWITCAKRPLTAVELQHALAIEEGEPELDSENLPEIEDMLSVCAGLVTIDEESHVIRLVHYTTQEFFERTQRDWFPAAHADIANVCTTYLSHNVFGSGFCQSDSDFEERLKLNPLYNYAAENWGHHVRESKTSCPNTEFLRSHTKASACTQVLFVNSIHRFRGYSQIPPSRMNGLHLAAWLGLTEIMGRLIADGHNPECKDSRDRSPLSWAAERGHGSVVRLLLARPDVKTESQDDRGRTPLLWAAKQGHEAVVRLLLEQPDVKTESKDDRGRTPLSWAARQGHDAVARVLLAHPDVKADSQDDMGYTPLSWAAEKGHEAMVRLLLARPDVQGDSRDHIGCTPLWYAAARGHVAVVRLLLARPDVKADSQDYSGRTPLSSAVERGHEGVVRLLESYL